MVGNDISNRRNFNGISIWALALGCIVGWGSVVMPGSTFIPNAGPLGTILGILLASLMAIVICHNYSCIVAKYPDQRGSYTYTRLILGEDHAFLVTWSILLAYVSLLWANSYNFVVLTRALFGDVFKDTLLYNIAGYNVYLEGVVFTIAVKTIFVLIATFAKRIANALRVLFAIVLFVSVAWLFVGVVGKADFSSFSPAFTDKEPIFVQIMNVAVFAPFLFKGFESVTHVVGMTKFPSRRIFLYAGLAILTGMLVYVFFALTASSGMPERYSTWMEYMDDLKNLQGVESVPVFYNAYHLMGDTGLLLVGIAAFCALATGVLGFHRAAARVLAIMADAKLMPKAFAKENRHGVLVNANLILLLISIPVFFLGRTVIGWNRDVSSFAAAIAYAYMSVCAIKVADGNKWTKASGFLGSLMMLMVFVFLLLPNIFAKDLIARESYILLTAWSLMGMAYYWFMFWKDKEGRFGKSTIMWLVMVGILFFATVMWSQKTLLDELNKIYATDQIPSILVWSDIMQFVVILIAIIFLFSLFTIMINRENALDIKYKRAEEHKKMVISENVVLSEYSARLMVQKREIEQQKERIQKQKDEIQSSINYAYNIQHSLLTPECVICDIFPDHFLLYKPRNVVSGDFYWMDQFGDYKVCVVGDCTGHGVPGGFMSMLGITNLNYIVGRVLDPDRILNKLREAIINGLRQKDDEPLDAVPPTQMDRSRDGLDCAAYVINEKELTLSYAGANNPLVLIRGNEIQVYKADKMPVGIYVKLDPFTCTEIQLQKGDCIYTFSDGFQDQLNHVTKKKFLSKHLRELLLEIHDMPMEQQKTILEHTFDDWRGPAEKQVDDVVIFGVRI